MDSTPQTAGALSEDALGRRAAPGHESARPLAVVRPSDAAGVAATLRLAGEAGVPVVPYGAGTGLMGGARSLRPGLVLDTVRLSAIEVLPGDGLVWAGSGAVLAGVDAALRAHGLCLGHDPWTFPVATVGGPISTNGLGYKGGRYGGMGDQVVALEVVLADGTTFRTPAVPRHSTGPDLARLFVGAEGTLGVITAAALKAYPIPERLAFLQFRFERFEDGFEAVRQMCVLGMRPSFLDYGEEHASLRRGTDEQAPILYLGFEGFEEEVDACAGRARRIGAACGGEEAPPTEAEAMWANRHVVAERFARNRREPIRGRDPHRDGVAFDYVHAALPSSQVLPFRAACHEAAAAAGAGLGECGLWTGPEMFSCYLHLPDADGGAYRLSALVDDLLRLAQDLGGSMEYCHGAGVRLAHLMEREWGAGFEVMRRLKAALDPTGVLNPGKLGL